MTPERCDALIVGGGPAGSSCARQLRQAGLDVLVLDKERFPRDKVCAGWVTSRVLETLQIDIDDYRRHYVLQPITGFRSGMIDGTVVDTDYGRTVSYGIRRCEFDTWLLEHSGARVAAGEPLQSMQRRDGHWIVNQRIETPLIIGAGGHFCPVARWLGARVGSSEVVVSAKAIEFEMTRTQQRRCVAVGERPELYFCRDLRGYGWLFRKGNYINIGLGREDDYQLAGHVADFCDFLRRQGRIVPADLPGRFRGHAYLLYGHGDRRLLDDGVVLIGDAAGLACQQSGEGIRPAIESGLLAAATIVAAGGEYPAARLEPYRAALAAHFGPPMPAAHLPGGMAAALRAYIAAQLFDTAWFTRKVVLDRWFLHHQQGALQTARQPVAGDPHG